MKLSSSSQKVQAFTEKPFSVCGEQKNAKWGKGETARGEEPCLNHLYVTHHFLGQNLKKCLLNRDVVLINQLDPLFDTLNVSTDFTGKIFVPLVPYLSSSSPLPPQGNLGLECS